jgi:hypothetical protein
VRRLSKTGAQAGCDDRGREIAAGVRVRVRRPKEWGGSERGKTSGTGRWGVQDRGEDQASIKESG